MPLSDRQPNVSGARVGDAGKAVGFGLSRRTIQLLSRVAAPALTAVITSTHAVPVMAHYDVAGIVRWLGIAAQGNVDFQAMPFEITGVGVHCTGNFIP